MVTTTLAETKLLDTYNHTRSASASVPPTLLPTLLQIHFQQIKLKISPNTLYQGAQTTHELFQTNNSILRLELIALYLCVCGGGIYMGILTDTMGTNIITDAVNARVHQCSNSCWYNYNSKILLKHLIKCNDIKQNTCN